jgi:hypothetical protein
VSELRDRLDTREERVSELETQLARRSEIEEKVDTLAKREQEGKAPFFIKWYRWWENRDYWQASHNTGKINEQVDGGVEGFTLVWSPAGTPS